MGQGRLSGYSTSSLGIGQSDSSLCVHRTMFKPLVLLSLTAACAFVQASPKPCDELKAEISAKLDAKDVKGYEIAAVENDKVGDAKVIGSCDGGTKKLTYVRK